jgi:two-component system CheB/CheR fusion protein
MQDGSGPGRLHPGPGILIIRQPHRGDSLSMRNPALPTPSVAAALAEALLDTVTEIGRARTLEEVTARVRSAVRSLLGADGATFVLRDGELCHYADEDAIAPLWKGQRFAMHQ